MRKLHVAAAQIHSGGPVAETLKRVERQACAAATVGAEVILFAEGALHGYDYDLTPDLLRQLAEPTDGPPCAQVSRMAQRHGITILIGFFERGREGFYNSLLVARPNGVVTAVRKHVLTEGELRAGLAPGPKERPILDFNGVRVAMIICADGGIDGLHEDLRERGADYRFCPTGGGGKVQDMLHEADLLTPDGRKKYIENRPRVFNTDAILDDKQCPYMGFASANALGPAGRQTCHQGHCMIVDNNRVMRAQIPGTIVLEHMQDQMIHAELTFA